MGLEYAPLVERACMFGGPGTPMVSEFCVTELGALQGTGPMAARSLVADALDLRYRLPMLWRQVQAGQVRAWQARKVAEQTRLLSWDACVELDAALSGFLSMMTWSRFQRSCPRRSWMRIRSWRRSGRTGPERRGMCGRVIPMTA